MKQFFRTCALILLGVTVANGLKCFNCISTEDADCINNPKPTPESSSLIMDIASNLIRCMTIHARDENNEEVVVRQCTVVDRCKGQVNEETGFEYGTKMYRHAKCEECQTDFCNNRTLL